MTDFSKMKLGKLPPKFRSTDLKLANYVGAVPSPPKAVDFTYGVKYWGKLDNDRLGCCTISAIGHAIQTWRFSLKPIPPNSICVPMAITNSVIEHYYSAWDGWNPANSEATDNGGVESDVLRLWRGSTFTIGAAGHNLKAYASVNPQNLVHVMQTIEIFGGIYVGIRLPLSAQNQDVWDVSRTPEGEPGSWGGHAIWVPKYDENGLTCVTWGQLQPMTWDFWLEYVDEAWALMSDTDFNSPFPYFPYETMLADVKAVTG